MVRVSATIVTHGGPHRLGHGTQVCQNLLEGAAGPLCTVARSLVEIVDVGRVMAVVVDFHRLGVNVRLILGRRIGQRVELKWPRCCLRPGQTWDQPSKGYSCGSAQECSPAQGIDHQGLLVSGSDWRSGFHNHEGALDPSYCKS